MIVVEKTFYYNNIAQTNLMSQTSVEIFLNFKSV